MKRIISLIVIGVMFFSADYCLSKTPGEKGAVFLKLSQGARPIGMGETFVAIADDINALYWNPAGIADVKNRQATFMYADWLEEITYNYLAYIHPQQIMGGIMGGGLTLLDSGSIDRTIDQNGKIGDYDAKDIALTLSYAKKLQDNCNLGVSLKYIQMKIDNEKSTGIALDIGCLYKPTIENLTFGANIQNLGPKLKAFISEKDALPLNIKVGGAYKLLDKALTLSLDVNFPSDNDTNFNLGAEYWFKEMAALRAGYKTLTKDELKSSDLTFGAGFRLPGTGIGLDYAYCDYGDLDNTHRVSLVTKF
ncbi:MAG: PorV/PorQ family protein [bacterium]